MNDSDPRVRRTRQLLRDAFSSLIAERSFHSISVQDIADRATVNRATFYAHFEDKYALLNDVVGEWFRTKVDEAGLRGQPFRDSALRGLVETVLEFVRAFLGGCRPADRDLAPMLETRMQTELAVFLEGWLGAPPADAPGSAARLASWTIFGSAMDWAQGGEPQDLSTRVGEITAFVLSGLQAIRAQEAVTHGV